ncbi:hypothetical protein ACFYTC_06390 [Actinomadura nitritigenes]|uniref:hypothetical protein n=1 Tax=Actinomadura nitritigenes TaxID=134602 RepID=UPI0036C5AECC
MGEHAVEKAAVPAPPVPAPAGREARPSPPAGDARATLTAVMEAVDGLAPASDGTLRTTYRETPLSLTRDRAERLRAAARSALADGLERGARRADLALTRYEAHARLDEQMPISSGAIKAWASLTQSGYHDPGPDLPALKTALARSEAAARQALGHGSFTEAARHLADADAASAQISALVGRYIEQTLQGGERLLTTLEITEQVAFITLGVLATVASGGAALGLAPEVLGTGIGGLTLGETLTAVSVGAPIAANIGKGAVAAAQGDTVDWTSIALDTAVQIVLVRLGGRLTGALFARFAGDPAAQTLARQAVAALAAGLATHELSQAFAVTVDQVLARWRGRFSWQGFADDLILHLTDPAGLFMAALSSAVHLGVHRKVTAPKAVSARPTPTAPAKSPGPEQAAGHTSAPKRASEPAPGTSVPPPHDEVTGVAADDVTAVPAAEGVSPSEGAPAPRLARGNFGERAATEWLAAEGHTILSYKPDVRGTNQGGIDMVTMKGQKVFFVDNKALTRAGNVSSVSALTTNFEKNKAAVLRELKAALAGAGSAEERTVLRQAVGAIEQGRYVRVVTNANVAPEGKTLSGLSSRLASQGIEFIDVMGGPR